MAKPVTEWPVRGAFARGWRSCWEPLIAAAVLAGCGGDGSGGGSGPPPNGAQLDTQVYALARNTLGLTGDPATARGARQTIPNSDPLVKLGQLLFFSQTLGAGYDVSCGTCHHTDFGGSDGLSISVGVVPKRAATVGPGREIDPARDLDPSADGGPNMHRNSISTFNTALFDRSLMFDGRVFVLDAATAGGGHGQRIRTPESGQAFDANPLDGLLEFTMKFPVINDNEMRSFFYVDLATPADYREHLTQRLRGNVDTQYNPRADAAANWLARFRSAFQRPTATADEVITSLNVQRALSAYIKSQIFVDTPWRRYLQGNAGAISTPAKQGAMLFLASQQAGGLGCGGCHAGDRFTDEAFHNVGFPQLGRGFSRSDRRDLGRWLATRVDDDLHAFRTPSLLNVAQTAPYGHAGSFATLADLLAYHTNPRQAFGAYDFSLRNLVQFNGGQVTYPDAQAYTGEATSKPNFLTAETRLPRRALSSAEMEQLIAFLQALTDNCVATPACIGQWAPSEADDTDGHTLIRDRPLGTPLFVDAERPSDYPSQITLDFPNRGQRTTFADVEQCADNIGSAANNGTNLFVQRSEAAFGLVDRHGYGVNTWFGLFQPTVEVAMIGGGVTAAYLDDDCWPDLAFTGGDVSGQRFYRNAAGTKFTAMNPLPGILEREFTGTALADLDGDYRREMILGNIKPGAVPIYSPSDSGYYGQVAVLPMARPTYGMSFAPLDDSGNLYLYLAHWSGGTGTNGSSPALWRYEGAALYPWDRPARTTSYYMDQRFNFTPRFADFTGDGRIDLVVASDFNTSSTLRNVSDGQGAWHFVNDTERAVITDQNGMGSTLLDIDNDGTMEWFVTSILDPSGTPAGNWGATGNRLYRSTSTAQRIAFQDITTQSGVRDGYWGWGACAADFNNDGFIDLFHVNGFGRIPDDVVTGTGPGEVQRSYRQSTSLLFQGKPSRLFINNANGTFTDRAGQWGIGAPSEGRGVVCFDYDRDGDVDIAAFDHSSNLQFFENHGGSAAGRHFLGIRVVGAAPNTDAIGAKVYVTSNVGTPHGVQTQLRLAEANSNFNSQNLPDMHFGVGQADVVNQIRVVWPGGGELRCPNVAANQFVLLDQRAGQGACPAPVP